MISPFALFSFLNVDAGNLITLMRAKPAWGIFTSLVALSVLLFFALAGYKLFAANRRESPLSISIRETARPPRQLFTRDVKLILSVLSLLMIASIFWLWRLAH
jgi:hypothetical protein